MVVQSLDCVATPIQSSIANAELGGGTQQCVMVSRAEKSSEGKTAVKDGLKGAKTAEDSNDSPMQRRSSARIHAAKEKAAKVKAAEELREKAAKEKATEELRVRREAEAAATEKAAEELGVRRKAEAVEDIDEGKHSDTAKTNKRHKKNRNEHGEGTRNGEIVSEKQSKLEASPKSEVKSRVGNVKAKVDSENVATVTVEKTDSLKVKETIRLFNKHYLHFVQEEEKRCAKVVAERKGAKKADRKGAKKASKSKKAALPEDSKTLAKRPDQKAITKKAALPEDSKTPAKRPDLKAITKMMENNDILNPEKRIGNIPGIEVGHQFYSRAEMVVVGFHSHWLNGIDYMGQSYAKVHNNYEFPIAVAIVISGMYEDDLDNAEDVVYTGQGGHNLTGDKRQIRDQKLERGNLALKNCVEQCVPVRVVRGHDSSSSYTGKVYTYDGLYKVVNYWAEKGISGFTVYKFRLRRLEAQPMLTTNQVYFTRGRVPQSTAEIRGLVCEDITGGQEDMPIPATNLVDDPPVPPTGFTYCKSIKLAKNVKLPMAATGCKCKDRCIDPSTCECALRNGSDFPYVSRDGGRLVEAKDVVFECGPKCGCGPGCLNRTSQRGPRYRLEVFRTAKKGWAVRSWDFIPSGAPVCEYTGILSRAEDMERVLENNYIFDIDCLQTIKGIGGRERRSQNAAYLANILNKSDDQGSESVPEFCIDAGSTGNIARFINHCCEPNLFVQCVLSTHHDLKFARVMLFAADNIPPLQELTYDYGYALDSVLGSDGKIKQMPCYCGATGCRKRLF